MEQHLRSRQLLPLLSRPRLPSPRSHQLTLVSSQADGIICVKTGQAVLVAEYVTPTPTGEATKIVEGVSHFFRAFAELSLIVSPPSELGDYLLGVGF